MHENYTSYIELALKSHFFHRTMIVTPPKTTMERENTPKCKRRNIDPATKFWVQNLSCRGLSIFSKICYVIFAQKWWIFKKSFLNPFLLWYVRWAPSYNPYKWPHKGSNPTYLYLPLKKPTPKNKWPNKNAANANGPAPD